MSGYIATAFCFFWVGFWACSLFVTGNHLRIESARLKKVGEVLCSMIAVASRFIGRADRKDGDLFWRLAARALKLTNINEPMEKFTADEITDIQAIQNGIDVKV